MIKFDVLQAYEKCYDAMLPAQEKGKDGFVWFTGLPHPIFNAVLHLRSNANLAERVDALIAKAPSGVPLSFWVHDQNEPANLAEILKERGFKLLMNVPLMIWKVQDVILSNCEIKLDHTEIFYDLLAKNFHLDEITKKSFVKMLSDSKAENYVVYIEGRAVGTGTLFPTGNTAGIFNISTSREFQRRGCGKAMMQFLMKRAKELGMEYLILHSTPVGIKLYSSLGFEKCLDVEMYTH